MATQIITKEAGRTIYKTSAIAVVCLIAYFLLIKLLGLTEVVELRYLNLIVMIFAIGHILIRERKESNNQLEFLSGLMHGTLASILIAIGFAAFVFFYLSYVDTALMQHIILTESFGKYLNPLSASLITFLEGISSGVVISFALLWYYSKE